ncbi:hypothetical protein CSKR_108533 [Clonorchis sinensis]|uniref:Uncharacterized protein n=1 Tax=Clonorchis sinensis TaxID=79923 RepID=A0A419QHS3_CLOSI|nr:hypothetical protein CSKR_108533 [Clonorchis sinensis]
MSKSHHIRKSDKCAGGVPEGHKLSRLPTGAESPVCDVFRQQNVLHQAASRNLGDCAYLMSPNKGETGPYNMMSCDAWMNIYKVNRCVIATQCSTNTPFCSKSIALNAGRKLQEFLGTRNAQQQCVDVEAQRLVQDCYRIANASLNRRPCGTIFEISRYMYRRRFQVTLPSKPNRPRPVSQTGDSAGFQVSLSQNQIDLQMSISIEISAILVQVEHKSTTTRPDKKSFSCSTLSVPNCRATRRLHEGWDTARVPKPRQGRSRGRGRVLTADLPCHQPPSELCLDFISPQANLPDTLQYSLQVICMLWFRISVHNDILSVHGNILESLRRRKHQAPECEWCPRQTKQHSSKLILGVPNLGRYFLQALRLARYPAASKIPSKSTRKVRISHRLVVCGHGIFILILITAPNERNKPFALELFIRKHQLCSYRPLDKKAKLSYAPCF